MAKNSNISENKLKSILKRHVDEQRILDFDLNINLKGPNNYVTIPLSDLEAFELEINVQNGELKLSYENLDAQREKFAKLYEAAPISYFILDHLGIIEDVNQTGIDLLKQSKLVLQNKRFYDFIFWKQHEKFAIFLETLQKSKDENNIEIQMHSFDKQILFTRIHGTTIYDRFSLTKKFYITVIDVTEIYKAQYILKETNERLEMTLRASSTGTWRITSQKNKIELDEFSCNILDLPTSEFQGDLNKFLDFVSSSDREQVENSFLKCVKYAKEIDLEFQIISNKGIKKDVVAKGKKISLSESQNLFAGILMDVTERKNLAREAEVIKRDQQRAVLSAILEAQENERKNISRALHDSVCQILYGIRLNLQSIPQLKSLKEELKNVNHLLNEAIKETRGISYELTPTVLKDFGFSAGVKEMAQRLCTKKFKIKTTINNSIDKTSATIQLYVFRIIQELINNSINHANASIAVIIVSEYNEEIFISVSDNGNGFTISEQEALRKGSGLRAIQNQVFLLKGNINFKTSKNGTAVQLTLNKSNLIDLNNKNQ